ncbi:MAG: hypothetical protein GY870_02560 [archaeon]|nr:hypothetical protein [archaeon]
MTKICQILLVGSDPKKLEMGIVQLGANKIIIITPDSDKYYAVARSITNKYDNIGGIDVSVFPIMEDDSFAFAQNFKRILSENFKEFDIKINASTDVRNWKLLAYFATTQFLPYLKDHGDNRIIFYEIVGGDSLKLSDVEFKNDMDEEEIMKKFGDRKENSKYIDAKQLKSKDVLPEEDAKYYDDGWGKPDKRPLPRIEIYPIETLTSTEQYIVDIISRQELSIDEIRGEYYVLTDKDVSDGLLSRYLGQLKNKAIVIESPREGRNKQFKLTEYGLKYVLPILKE